MKDNINIEKLFSDKLANHESVVNSKLWSGIQSQIGVGASSTAVAAKGVSMATKWIIGVSSVVAVSTVALVLNYTHPNESQETPTEIVQDSTQKVADLKETENAVSEELVTKASSTPKLADNSTSRIEEVTDVIRQENESMTYSSPSPEKLIVRQAAPVKTPTKDEGSKPAKSSKESKTEKPVITEPIVAKQELTGAVQEWKKTNVFSPNNDGVNDLFFLESKALKEFSITIINEKNDVVFISDDPNFKWDGTNYKTGEMVPQGSYGYIVFAVDVSNNPIKIFNTLKISR